MKKRFQDGGGSHFQLTKVLANGNDNWGSSTLSSHLAEHLHISHHPQRTGFCANHVRHLVFVDVLWIGNVVMCMKSFRTNHCLLCMKERYFLFHHRMKHRHTLLNQNLDIHKGCTHNPAFHRFTTTICQPVDDDT